MTAASTISPAAASHAAGAGRWVLPAVFACFVLSGLSGLIYQTAWMRQFAVVFGTSDAALAAVLAAYMAGLSLGAALAARWLHRVSRPVLVYGILELAIGGFGLAVQPMIGWMGELQILLLGAATPAELSMTANNAYYLIAAFLILLPATACMGATLPLLARFAVRREDEISKRVGMLYAANTVGAALGTLSAAFLLLPFMGLGNTIFIAAAINVLVFAIAATLPTTPALPQASLNVTAVDRDRGGRLILLLALVTGAVAFSWEVTWTRLLGQLLGGTLYAYATMLATFLLGLSVGSTLMAHWAKDRERARIGFGVTQLAIGLLSLGAFSFVDQLPSMLREVESKALAQWVCAAFLLPGAVAMGASFPAAVRWLATDAAGTARASARVFAWNTIGTILGALGAGYFLLPGLGYAGLAAIAAIVSVLAGAVAALPRPRRAGLAIASLAGVVLIVVVRPETPWNILRSGGFNPGVVKQGEIAYQAVGRSSNVLLIDNRSVFSLSNNGLPESGIEPTHGRSGRQSTAHWLAMLPTAIRPEAESMLVIGLGGGVTVEIVPGTIRTIEVAELEHHVLEANRSVADKRLIDPLADPRVKVHVNDARGMLRLLDRRYDVIVSQPSHPWTSGASHLFTREFLALVNERLTDDGVFSQWMGLQFVDGPLFDAFVATAADVFPEVALYMADAGSLILVASRSPMSIEATAARALAADPEAWRRVGVTHGEELISARILGAEGSRELLARAQPNRDLRNLFQTRGPRVTQGGLSGGGLSDRLDGMTPPPEIDYEEPLFVVRSLVKRGAAPRARALAESMSDAYLREAAVAVVDGATGQGAEAEYALRELVRRHPERNMARHLLLSQLLNQGGLENLDRWLGDRVDETSRAIASTWKAVSDGRVEAARANEGALAGIPTGHPLAPIAARLRIDWRLGAGGSALDEALPLARDLAIRTGAAPDLLRLATVQAALGNVAAVLHGLQIVQGRLDEQQLERAYDLVLDLPSDPATLTWRSSLLGQLEQRRVRRSG